MKTTRFLTTLVTTAAIILATTTTACAAETAPNSMTALGDSITRAFNACGWYSDCTAQSWSTGEDTAINSHYLRIKAINPAIDGHVHNDARSGAKIADLPEQATTAVTRRVDYVTILIGANDACTGTEEQMTSVVTYRAHLDRALATLKEGLPHATVYLLSIPDIKRLWQVGKDSATARTFWSVGNICQSLLRNPTSTDPADVARRDRVRQRVRDYNTQLAQACAAYGPRCVFDNNAVFRYPFQFDQVSRWDYFHPNVEGQKVLAHISWEAQAQH